MMAHPIKRKPLSAGQYQPVVSPVPSDSAMSDGLDIISKSHIESNQSPSKLLLGLDQNIELDHYPVNSSKPSISPTVSSYAHLADPSSTAQGTTWKIYWHQPTFIIATLLCGFALALAHHFYYNSMSGSTAGDAAKQAWPIRFGTAFAFLVIACLRAATASALGQYAWTIVRRRPLKISCLDDLFGMTGNPIRIFSLELLKQAWVAALLGLVFWCLSLAALAPPATLTVRAKNLTAQAFIPRLNYSKPSFEVSAGVWEPTSLTNRIALQSAFSFDVVPLSQVVPSQDWSYDIQFFGPTLECRIAKDTEQPYFDRIASQYEAQSSTFIYSQVGDDYWNATYNNNHNGPAELIYSAWSVIPLPAGAPNNWSPYCNITEQGTYDPCDLDPFTDWQTNWPTGVAQVSPEIWIQTSNLSIVCASVNASFDVTIASVGGSQEIIQNNVQIVGNGSYPFILTMDNQMGIGYDPYFNETEEDPNFATTFWSGYSSHVYAMGSILQGNITILESFYENTDTLNLSHTFTPPGYRYMFANATTNVLASGLIACDEIFNTPFKRLHSNIDPEKLPGNNSTEEDLFVFNNTFPTSPGMCRNGSLLRAIQDLANNVTISMPSSSDLTSLEPTPRTLVTSNTVNVYEYSPRFLVLSYAIALFLSCFATAIGLYSLYLNGVSHSVAFSSIVATTRNPDLDSLMRDSSLGALPVKMEVEETRLKFGRLLETSEKRTSEASGVSKVAIAQDTTHFAFGLEGSVGELKNRRTYT